MTMATKLELLKGCLKRYLAALKPEKKVILDELVLHTEMHRKAVIRALRNLQLRDPWKTGPAKRGRKIIYGPGVNVALKELWEMSHQLCAERLAPIVSEYVKILKRDNLWKHSDSVTKLLLKMSLGTMKDRIAKFQKIKRRNRNTTTKPGNLKILIPIRRGPWEKPLPGYGEIDTVVHCGSVLGGDMAYSVNFTDIATCWSGSAAQMNKGQARTITSIEKIKSRLPFPMLGLDPDTGSEFINWNLYAWSVKNKIELSRSRPNHKNDNAHIEQKNYTTVRNFLGYRRIDTEKQVALMNELYDVLHFYVNYFQPTMKCVKKERIGSRYVRKYDAPQTPYQRVLAHKKIDDATKKELTRIYNTLNPLILKREIDRLTEEIFKKPR